MKLIDSELTATSPVVSDVAVSALLEIIIAAETMNFYVCFAAVGLISDVMQQDNES